MSDYVKYERQNTPMWDREKDKELEGKFIEFKTDIGPNNSNIYMIQKSDKELIGVWGTSILDDFFKNLPLGTDVKLVYQGKKKGKKGTSFHSFELFHKPLEEDNDIQEAVNETFGK